MDAASYARISGSNFNGNACQYAFVRYRFSVYFYAYAITQVPAGLLIDYFGPRRMLTVAAFLVALGITCFAAAVSIPLLFVGRILIGIGSAFAFTGCIKITRIWFKAMVSFDGIVNK